jgi:Tat protein translocase TatB subunit
VQPRVTCGALLTISLKWLAWFVTLQSRRYHENEMHFADSIVIFLLALILFGPKKLPEIARQIGKLMVEFRRASNEFKAQIDEELRAMEQQERQKKLEGAVGQASTVSAPENTSENATPEAQARVEEPHPVILPPSTGETVSTGRTHIPVAPPDMVEAAEIEPHPVFADALEAEKNGSDTAGSELHNAQATVNHG